MERAKRPMKEVLIIYYTQTGQLLDILKNVESTLSGPNVNIDYHEIKPEPEYDFPWKNEEFYDIFPESFLEVPQKINSPETQILNKKYDLIILGYQVWYLTPSRPISSFLQSNDAKILFENTPVVTLVACRNMWLQAQEKVKRHLKRAKGQLVGHIALVDNHVNHISVITIEHWMIKGKKDRLFGIFPKPGVSDEDISAATRFGKPISQALLSGDFSGLQDELLRLKSLKVNPYLVRTDERGNVLFSKWANLLIKKGGPGDPKRLKWIGLFKYYLLFAIWVIAPIVFIVFLLTYLPMTPKRRREKEYYSSVALNEN